MLHRTVRTIGAVGLALTVALTAAGCSGEDKVSKKEYEKSFVETFGEGETGEKAAKCLADQTYDELSAETVNALAEGDDEYKASKKDEEVLEKAMEKCMEEMLG